MILAAGFLLALITDAAGSDSTIGRWCDRMIPNLSKYNRTMAIVIANDGKVILKSNFNDGSSSINRNMKPVPSVYYIGPPNDGSVFRNEPCLSG